MARVRDKDGILIQQPGHYADPGEAMKFWWAGELRLGCTHKIPNGFHSSPCCKTPKHDPDARGNPTKCGIHSAAAFAKRKAAKEARYQKWRNAHMRKAKISDAAKVLEPALRQIADGHNDARGLAQEVISALDNARNAK